MRESRYHYVVNAFKTQMMVYYYEFTVVVDTLKYYFKLHYWTSEGSTASSQAAFLCQFISSIYYLGCLWFRQSFLIKGNPWPINYYLSDPKLKFLVRLCEIFSVFPICFHVTFQTLLVYYLKANRTSFWRCI